MQRDAPGLLASMTSDGNASLPTLNAIPIMKPDFITSPLVSGLSSRREASDKGSLCCSKF